MALTNAERQARHRERQREKLRNAAISAPLRNDVDARGEGIQSIEDLLLATYYDTAAKWFDFLGGEDDSRSAVADRRRAMDAFSAEQIGFVDLMLMLKEQAFARLNEHWAAPEEHLPRMSWRRHADETRSPACAEARGVT